MTFFPGKAQTTPVALLIDDADATVSWSPRTVKPRDFFTDAMRCMQRTFQKVKILGKSALAIFFGLYPSW